MVPTEQRRVDRIRATATAGRVRFDRVAGSGELRCRVVGGAQVAGGGAAGGLLDRLDRGPGGPPAGAVLDATLGVEQLHRPTADADPHVGRGQQLQAHPQGRLDRGPEGRVGPLELVSHGDPQLGDGRDGGVDAGQRLLDGAVQGAPVGRAPGPHEVTDDDAA